MLSPKEDPLNNRIYQFTNIKDSHTSAASASPRAPIRVLVAEDGFANRQLALRLLQREGHSVTAVRTGVHAVRELRYRDFDLVLMDIEMPGMDGLSATRAIRAWERETGGHTPIVALTSNNDPEKCFSAGMDGFLSKPLQIDELKFLLRRCSQATSLEREYHAGQQQIGRASCRERV